MLILTLESYFVFGLKDVWVLLLSRLRRNQAAPA
jgi:hypothetical protein